MGEKLLERGIKILRVNVRGAFYYCVKHSQIIEIEFTPLRMWLHTDGCPCWGVGGWCWFGLLKMCSLKVRINSDEK